MKSRQDETAQIFTVHLRGRVEDRDLFHAVCQPFEKKESLRRARFQGRPCLSAPPKLTVKCKIFGKNSNMKTNAPLTWTDNESSSTVFRAPTANSMQA